jgi:hypothetical protein
MKTLNLGNIELMPIEREFSSYKEFLGWCDRLSNGWKISDYKLIKYIRNLKKLGIFKNIENNYSVEIISEILIDIEDDFESPHRDDESDILIDDPIEIEKFLNYEDSVGLNKDGIRIEIKRGDSHIINWSGEKSMLFVIREI